VKHALIKYIINFPKECVDVKINANLATTRNTCLRSTLKCHRWIGFLARAMNDKENREMQTFEVAFDKPLNKTQYHKDNKSVWGGVGIPKSNKKLSRLIENANSS